MNEFWIFSKNRGMQSALPSHIQCLVLHSGKRAPTSTRFFEAVEVSVELLGSPVKKDKFVSRDPKWG